MAKNHVYTSALLAPYCLWKCLSLNCYRENGKVLDYISRIYKTFVAFKYIVVLYDVLNDVIVNSDLLNCFS